MLLVCSVEVCHLMIIMMKCFFPRQFGEVPMLHVHPHRPVLPPNRPPSAADLCSFFATLNASLNDGPHIAPTSSGGSTAGPPRPVLTSQQSLTRARSAPDVSQSQHHRPGQGASGAPLGGQSAMGYSWSSTDSQHVDLSHLTPTEFIEEMVLRDFLDPLQQS